MLTSNAIDAEKENSFVKSKTVGNMRAIESLPLLLN